jgi:hypothetical protein
LAGLVVRQKIIFARHIYIDISHYFSYHLLANRISLMKDAFGR